MPGRKSNGTETRTDPRTIFGRAEFSVRHPLPGSPGRGFFLVANVRPNHCLIGTHSLNEIAPCPKTHATAVLPLTEVGPRDMNRTLAVQTPHHLSHYILGRDGDQHMHMVGLQVSFQHPALLLPESSNSCGPPAKPGVYPKEIRWSTQHVAGPITP